MSRNSASRLYGDLDLLILRTLQVSGPAHGLDIIEAIAIRSEQEIEVEYGALYRALYRLEEQGLLSSEWKVSDKNRRAKFYHITPEGRSELQRRQQAWSRHTRAVGRVLGLEGEVSP